MTRNVKGKLFAEYVRMLRCRKRAGWAAHLAPEDLPYLERTIVPDEWYPMDVYERLGIAILKEFAGGDLDAVRKWGQRSLEELRTIHAELIAEGDPRESLMRFKVVRNSFFDFEAVQIQSVTDRCATILANYHMTAVAEEAAAYQTLGFFEQLIRAAGGRDCHASLGSRSWEGAPETTIELRWMHPSATLPESGGWEVDSLRGMTVLVAGPEAKKIAAGLSRANASSVAAVDPREALQLAEEIPELQVCLVDCTWVSRWGLLERLRQRRPDVVMIGLCDRPNEACRWRRNVHHCRQR